MDPRSQGRRKRQDRCEALELEIHPDERPVWRPPMVKVPRRRRRPLAEVVPPSDANYKAEGREPH